MTKLKSIYPLYLNNVAQQPNTDLAVTDKFTGEVAFHVAQADATTIDAAIAGSVEAAEPMARMAFPASLNGSMSSRTHCASRRASRLRTARGRSAG